MDQFIESIRSQWLQYKKLGNAVLTQLTIEELNWRANESVNSIAIIITHVAGNMRSRFTDFLTADGEKPNRMRDQEFENHLYTHADLTYDWEEGWAIVFGTLDTLTPNQLTQTIYIRKKPLLVMEALHRQLAHYAYHIGQMVQMAKVQIGQRWENQSIPLGKSEQYNQGLSTESDI